MTKFLKDVLEFRKNNKQKCHTRIKQLLPNSLGSAFSYIVSLSHEQKPDYNLIKLFITSCMEDEVMIFDI